MGRLWRKLGEYTCFTAITHPRVIGLILPSIFLCRQSESHWFIRRRSNIFRTTGKNIQRPFPIGRGNLVASYYKRRPAITWTLGWRRKALGNGKPRARVIIDSLLLSRLDQLSCDICRLNATRVSGFQANSFLLGALAMVTFQPELCRGGMIWCANQNGLGSKAMPNADLRLSRMLVIRHPARCFSRPDRSD